MTGSTRVKLLANRNLELHCNAGIHQRIGDDCRLRLPGEIARGHSGLLLGDGGLNLALGQARRNFVADIHPFCTFHKLAAGVEY